MRTFVLLTAALLTTLPCAAGAVELKLNSATDERLHDAQRRARADLSVAHHERIIVPPGHILQGSFDAQGRIHLGVVPREVPEARAHLAPATYAHCRNDLEDSTKWARDTFTDPADWSTWFNYASEGECEAQTLHTNGIQAFQFDTYGGGYGWADAFDYPTGSYFFIQCDVNGQGIIYGLGTGQGYEFLGSQCDIYHTGLPGPLFTSWDSKVTNGHSGTDWCDCWYAAIRWH